MSRGPIRSILADFWVKLERETGDIPSRIDLPPRTFERLVSEWPEGQIFQSAHGGRGPLRSVVLHVNEQRLEVHCTKTKPAHGVQAPREGSGEKT